MQRLWGRKISDLAFAEFLKILEFVAFKKGKIVSYIDRWYPSSKTCSECDYVLDKLDWDERYWVCPRCSVKHGRDSNASRVIYKVGASTLRLGDVSQFQTTIAHHEPRISLILLGGVGQKIVAKNRAIALFFAI